MLRLFEVARVYRAMLEHALALGFDDSEDTVLHEAGRLAGTQAVVTRDPFSFHAATIRVYVPATLISTLDAAVDKL